MNRSYALMEIREVDADRRIVEGIATTSDIAGDGDILVTEGIRFKLPLPFLYRHNSAQPLGKVIEANVTKDHIRVRIQMAADGVAQHIDEAWRMIKAGVIGGLSIGWETIEKKYDPSFGGYRHLKSIWRELSAVVLPADERATILSVRSADEAVLAAIGTRERTSAVRLHSNPAASGFTKGKAMTVKEHIAALEAKRAANDSSMDAIMEKCSTESRTRDDAEQETYDTLTRENARLDADIAAFREREKALVTRAAAVEPAAEGIDPEKNGVSQRNGSAAGRIEVRPNQPKGIGVARMAIAMVRANNNPELAAQMAKKYWPGSPEVELSLRTVIEAGDTTTSGWASQLVPSAQQMQEEFLELLRPQTIIGRIPGLRRVPFNISVPIETASGTVTWVGEAAPKPVTKLTLSSVTLRWAKAAAIVVITKELAKFSRPDAEMVVRDSMVKTLVRFFDAQFVGSAAEVSNVSPAGILNGKSATAVTGTSAAHFRTNMNTLLATMSAANVPLDNVVLLMSSTQAVALSLAVTDLGVPLFPNIDRSGGTLLGFPVIISEAVGTKIIALNAADVLLASDPAVSVDVSDTASAEMDDAPSLGETSPATTISTLKSFWQYNLIGIRVEQFITWKLARAASVEYLSPVAYVP